MPPYPRIASRQDLEALSRITAAAKASVKKLPARVSHPSTIPPTTPKMLVLPVPTPLTSQIVALGVKPTPALKIAATMGDLGLRLKEDCERRFERLCSTLQSQHRTFRDPQFLERVCHLHRSLYAKSWNSWASYVLEQAIPRAIVALRGCRTSVVNPTRSKRPFNQAAIPLLEQFFDQNAFPSRLDKCELASKCQMEYRQIHVWFQNRRSRSRKDGKELKTRSPSSPILKQLEEVVADALLPCEDELATDTHDEHTDDPFSWSPPSHAFPSPYPPLCSYNPFPISLEERVLELPWLRSPASRAVCPKMPVDMTVLIADFDQLSLSDRNKAPHPPPNACRESQTCQSHIGFTTRCSRAPHPALIRRSRRALRSSHPSRCAPTPTNSCTSPSSALVKEVERASALTVSSPLTATESSNRRSKRALPRRLPKYPPIQQSHRSPSPSLPALSSRATSTDSSFPSANASYSDIESPLSTPPALSIPLPSDVTPPWHYEGTPTPDLHAVSSLSCANASFMDDSSAWNFCTILDFKCDPIDRLSSSSSLYSY